MRHGSARAKLHVHRNTATRAANLNGWCLIEHKRVTTSLAAKAARPVAEKMGGQPPRRDTTAHRRLAVACLHCGIRRENLFVEIAPVSTGFTVSGGYARIIRLG